MSDLLALMSARGFSPRKVSVNHGGEYVSSCPVCGDGGKGGKSDRFHVWPEKAGGGLAIGRFWCRQCGVNGDTIAFMQQVNGVSFPEACSQLGIILPGRQSGGGRRYQPPPVLQAQQGWQPTTYPEPVKVWQEKAGNFLDDCQARLLNNQAAMQWLNDRGISADAAAAYRLGYNLSSKNKDRYRPRHSWGLPEKLHNGKSKMLWIPRGWVTPSFTPDGELIQLRIRRLDEDVAAFCSNIRHLPVDGSSMATMILHPEAEVFAVVESGLDAVLLAWTMSGKIGVMTTWNSSARPDARAHRLLERSSLILGGLDYDKGGDREQAWWESTYRQYRRLPALPGGAKDPGDAAKAGVDLYRWIVSGLPRGMQIKLGVIARTTLERRRHVPAPQETVQAAVQADVQPVAEPDQETTTSQPAEPAEPEVAELTLTNGKVIYMTDDRRLWSELSGEGKAVFSSNETLRMQRAMSTMSNEERSAAASQVVELKELFGGYIRAGRVITDADQTGEM